MVRKLTVVLLFCIGLLMLTGCPGPGDRMRMDETSLATWKSGEVCISIENPQDYQPVAIVISLRRTPSREKNYDFSPRLSISDGRLCIPPSYYHFLNGNKYVVEFVLHAARKNVEPRNFVVGVGVNNNQIYNFPLTDREIVRPYDSIDVPE